MITGPIKSQIDRIWEAFWSGGIANGLTVIEQITYLLFTKCLDELHTAREKEANLLKKPIESPVFKRKCAGTCVSRLNFSIDRKDSNGFIQILRTRLTVVQMNLSG